MQVEVLPKTKLFGKRKKEEETCRIPVAKLVMIMWYFNLVKTRDNISQYNFWLTQMRSYASGHKSFPMSHLFWVLIRLHFFKPVTSKFFC